MQRMARQELARGYWKTSLRYRVLMDVDLSGEAGNLGTGLANVTLLFHTAENGLPGVSLVI